MMKFGLVFGSRTDLLIEGRNELNIEHSNTEYRMMKFRLVFGLRTDLLIEGRNELNIEHSNIE
jgi:hemin uptake protein HemP